MNRGDAIQSVTHVADVDCYPCSGLNRNDFRKTGSEGRERKKGKRRKGERGGGFGRGAVSVGQEEEEEEEEPVDR